MGAARSIQDELAKLREAVANRKVEPICLAYLAFRKAAVANGVRPLEVFVLAEEALSGFAGDVVASAFSRRRCFLCQDGAVRCDDCEGTGYAKGARKCPACDGVGVKPCSFCRATGWAARDTIPAEITPNVLKKRQLANVKKDLKRLVKAIAGLGAGGTGRPPAELCRNLTRRVMRLRARLTDLAGSDALTGDEQVRLLVTASELETYLTRLRDI